MDRRPSPVMLSVSLLRAIAVMALVVTTLVGGIVPATAQSGSTSDVAIVTSENGQSAFDACYVLVDFSNEGCDENGDGMITFRDVPLGTYTLRQTADLGAGRSVSDSTINVTGATGSDGWEYFYVTIASQSHIGTSPQIAIYTTENGNPVYDACYVLVGYSNEGCDENQDGKITFDDIPWDTYTVRQTADLGPGRSVEDFTITVRGNINSAGWESFAATVTSAGGGAPIESESVDIALITREPEDGDLLTGTCYVLVGFSNEGCDENGDGQVTFDAVPYGSYTVRQTQTPSGYPTTDDFEINVSGGSMYEGPSLGVPQSFLVRQAAEQNAPGTRNVSVVFLDADTRERIVIGGCVEIVTASQVGCDRDLIDGQIDFLDVPEGGPYELRFSDLPVGAEVTGLNLPEAAVIIFAGPQDATSYTFYAFVDQSGQSSGASQGAKGTYEDMVGEWYGKRRDVILHADGSGIIDRRTDAFGNGITYEIVVDRTSSPVTATITSASPYGTFDPAEAPGVGDIITLTLEIYPDGVLLMLDIQGTGPPLAVCSVDDDTNVGNLCY